MNNKWKDEKRKDKIVSASVKFGSFRLSVHHYFGCGDTWFASSDIFDRLELWPTSLSEAKDQAKAMLLEKLQKAVGEIVKT